MAVYTPAKVNTQFITYVGLVSQASTLALKSNPTIAAGDFKVSTDGGALGNLGTLPTVTPASSVMVKYTLSTSEMNGANVTVVAIDAAGAEWCDRLDNFQTVTRQLEDLAYPATSGRSMVVDANGLVDANAVKLGPTGSGTAQTARDIGASVLLSSGSGTGQLDFTSGVVKANLVQIIATALTETAGQIAAGFKKLFDVAAPVFTLVSVNQTGDSYARLGAPAGASVSADVAAVKVDTAAVKVQTDKLTFTVANQVDSNVLDWKSATAPAMTGDAYARLGAPAGASVSADVAAVKVDTAAVKVQTDKLTFTVANQVDSNVLDWKSATAPAMTGDAFARLGAPVGASTSADIAAVQTSATAIKAKTDNLPEGIKKNTAKSAFPFQMVLSADHVTPATGLTITATRSIDGAAFGACANAAVEIGSGCYAIDLAAADLNGTFIILSFASATADTSLVNVETSL